MSAPDSTKAACSRRYSSTSKTLFSPGTDGVRERGLGEGVPGRRKKTECFKAELSNGVGIAGRCRREREGGHLLDVAEGREVGRIQRQSDENFRHPLQST
ncbi:hypothetical protein AAC387_Pa07g2270 [Persea americana]